MKLKIYDAKGSATDKSVNLSKDVFGIEPNDHAIYLDVKQHLANKRQGTHKAKERSEDTRKRSQKTPCWWPGLWFVIVICFVGTQREYYHTITTYKAIY